MEKDKHNTDDMTQCVLKHIDYPGKRRYSSKVQQSYRGVLSNDMFAQFEKEFKSCLTRRQQKKQWIINLLYPLKSTIEYFEYLEKFAYFEPGSSLKYICLLLLYFSNFIYKKKFITNTPSRSINTIQYNDTKERRTLPKE